MFYVRKDVEAKQLIDLFPKADAMFPGKPVLTANGRGFILGAKKDASQKTYYVKI